MRTRAPSFPGEETRRRSDDAEPIVRPGRNCWRIEPANRVAVLVDGEAYFSAFADAAERASHSIFIVGWDFHGRVRLRPERGGDGQADEIVALLTALLSRRASLNVYVLDWDFSMIYALEREPLPRLRFTWGGHPRLHFQLDGRVPLGGAQHQKIVVIDDALAFVGGFDFGARRWDSSEHRVEDVRRIDPWGALYPPHHDVQLACDGDAARALASLVHDRWQCATGDCPSPAPQGGDPWPASMAADVENVDVAIARTCPAAAEEPEIREVERLYLDAIAAARRSLYFENQYFTSSVVGQALCDRLQDRDGPEIVIVLSRGGSSWLEETTMNVLRARLLRRLRAADRYGRLRVCYPDVEGLGNARLTVHSKVLVVDDRLLRVGSANLNNRSMGLDSECDVALDAAGDLAVRERIARLRDRLLAEHLGQTPACVTATIASTGSLLRTIDALNGGRRGLRPLDGDDVASWLDCIVPAIVDPDRPVWADTLIDRMLPREIRRSSAARRWLWPATLVAAAAVLFIALRRDVVDRPPGLCP